MEDEELEISRIIFEKHFTLLKDEHLKLDVEQYKRVEKEYKRIRASGRNELSEEMVSEFKEFAQTVNLCLKLITKCPDKDILEEEVKDQVIEMMPQIDFEQVFLDKSAQLYHQA